jgi:hypothetical protein
MSQSPYRKTILVPPGTPRLADASGRQPEAVAPSIKPGLTLAAAIEPLLSIDDLAALLNCSRRLVERLRSAGKVPTHDIMIGKMPRWKPETIRP